MLPQLKKDFTTLPAFEWSGASLDGMRAALGLRVLLASSRPLLGLAGILASHALIHTPAAAGVPQDVLRNRIAGLGKALGPPWTQDQKLAALAGLLALDAR